MHTRFDQFSKEMVRKAVEGRGVVEIEAEVRAEIRNVDLRFTPDSSRPPVGDELGLLGRITEHPSTLEFFHNTPDPEQLRGCVIKHGDLINAVLRSPGLTPAPTLWIISSGRPDQGIEGLAFQPSTIWPCGIYEAPKLLCTCLVVVRELPATRDTLLVRLLGAGASFRRAISELRALPPDAPERRLALGLLLGLRLVMPADPAQQAHDEQECLVNLHEVYEDWHRKTLEEGRAQGVQQGLQQGERTLLLRQLRRRFGSQLDDEIERRVEAASLEQIEIWADRVLSATTLAAVLSD
jgi:hypothetical protein